MNQKLVVKVENFISGIFDNVYIVTIIGAILVAIASIALSTIIFIYSKNIKEDRSEHRKAIFSGIAILVVGICGCGILIYLAMISK